jgi:ubiquinone biosynthesis protein COQ4
MGETMTGSAFDSTLSTLTRDAGLRESLEQQVARTLRAFNEMLVSESSDTDKVFDVADSTTSGPATQESVRWLRRNPQMATLMDERYLSTTPWSIDELIRYPKGSLGRVFGSELAARGFDPEFYRRLDVVDDATYVELRWRQTHDLWHVITGFETHEIGEVGLQAVYLIQCRLPISSLLIASGLVGTTLNAPEQTAYLLRALDAGAELGSRAKCLLAQKWEEGLDRPVEDWQRELNVTPVDMEALERGDA